MRCAVRVRSGSGSRFSMKQAPQDTNLGGQQPACPGGRRDARECFGKGGVFRVERCGGLRWHVRVQDWKDPLISILADPDRFLESRAKILKQKRSRTVGVADGYVVKRYTFRSVETSVKDLFRQSYALRALHKAYQMELGGIAAPIPVAAAEDRVMRVLKRSYFVMREIPSITPLDEWNGDKRSSIYRLARDLAGLHQAGFSHRDLRHRNIVFNPAGQIFFLDQEQVSYLGEVSARAAIADLAWLAREAPNLASVTMADRARLLIEYCRLRGIADWRGWWKRIHQRVMYLNSGGRGAPEPKQPPRSTPVQTWPHPEWWDPFSDQPLRLSKDEKPRFGWDNLREYMMMGGTLVALSPLLFWRYHTLRPMSQRPTAKSFVGLSISPSLQYNDAIVEMVADLGVEELLVRVPTWDMSRLDEYEQFVRQFPGKRFLINILQHRESVTDPDGWREALRQIFARFLPVTIFFQVGNAVNRIKWGCAHIGEYLALLEIAEQVRAEFPGVKLVGSSVIDFAPLFSVRTLINARRYRLDVASSLLYVNRRGSPYSKQYHVFDLDAKIRALRSFVSVSNRSEPRLWITETNWPLLHTKPYTPNSGKPESTVDEPTQATYLTEYYRIAYETGLVEKVYWWQLIAPGYGLVDHRSGRLRKHPSYAAFRELLQGGLDAHRAR